MVVVVVVVCGNVVVVVDKVVVVDDSNVVVVVDAKVVVVVVASLFMMSRIAGHPVSKSTAVTVASTKKLFCFMVASVVCFSQYPTAFLFCK
jgi:hypothetical protein